MSRRPRRRADPAVADDPVADRARLDEEGWRAVPGVLAPAEAGELAARCSSAMEEAGLDLRVGDKRAAGTLRFVELLDRLPDVRAVFDHPTLVAGVHRFLGEAARLVEVTFRSPQPGYGGQKLHSDDVPLLDQGGWRVVTAILALCDFTAENGATAVLPGSHRRPDLQRQGGALDGHPDEVVLTGRAGTAFLFCGHLLHRGTTNRSTRPRPALQAVWRTAG